MRMSAFDAAKRFVEEHFPNCQAAVLGGSVVRGEATESSDLDIVILDEALPAPYRESFQEHGWPIEAFLHTSASYREFCEENCRRARPSLPKLMAEGVAIRDDGSIPALKAEANRLLEQGPPPWMQREIDMARYGITDHLEDFVGSTSHAENLFTAGKLAVLLHEFVLRLNQRWIGDGKWVVRALRNYDPAFCDEFVQAFDQFYKTGEKVRVIALADRVLAAQGGRFFAGFSVGKKE